MAHVHISNSKYSGERELAKRLAALDDSRLHLWFGLDHLPGCRDVDCLIWHESEGIFVVEVKAVSLEMVEAINLRNWKCKDRPLEKSPPCQAYDAMETLRDYFRRQQLPFIPFLISTVCWPQIRRSEWRTVWSDAHFGGDYSERMIFAEDISGTEAFRNRLRFIYRNPPVRDGSKYPFRHDEMTFGAFQRAISPQVSPLEFQAEGIAIGRAQDVEKILRIAPGRAKSPSPLESADRLLQKLERYYQEHGDSGPSLLGTWMQQLRALRELVIILKDAENINPSDPEASAVVAAVESRLKDRLDSVGVFGPLSRSLPGTIARIARDIRNRCKAAQTAFKGIEETHRKMSPMELVRAEISGTAKRFRQLKKQVMGDLNARKEFVRTAKEFRLAWERFIGLRTAVVFQSRFRPALKHLDRFSLTEVQEKYVEKDYRGAFRVQGASGTGKTIILLHRSLRLAKENPSGMVRIFTINRSLAELLRAALVSINGFLPDNLSVSAFYDFLRDCIGLFDRMDRYRLVDDRSGERIENSWQDFFNHPGRHPGQNVFAASDVRALCQSLRQRTPPIDPSRYLRQEMVFIQSAFRSAERPSYLDSPRTSRSIPLQRSQRNACLKVLAAWEDWLNFGDLCDVDTLSLHAASYFFEDQSLSAIRAAFPTDHALIDEYQDFSTLELAMARRLVETPESGNAYFLVGDPNQKVYPKHHSTLQAGFDFTGGRSVTLAENHRNTRQILRAAYCIPQTFKPEIDEAYEILDPQLSPYDGDKPKLIETTESGHVSLLLRILEQRRGNRMAVVSENMAVLEQVLWKASRRGFTCYELFRNEDLDLWKRQEGDSLSASLVISRMEAVKGFEFDTVIAADLSAGVIPTPGTPEAEFWREAAVIYSALTRARDELIITYVNRPSPFLTCMRNYVEFWDASADGA